MYRLDPTQLMLCYDGTLEGFFSVVFEAYCRHAFPEQICPGRMSQPSLGQQVLSVKTDLSHAERVRVGLASRAGRRFFTTVKTAFLSDEPGKEMQLFSYIVKGMNEGYRADNDLSVPCVAAAERLAASVLSEREKVYQFLRFEELENGVFFARVNPKAAVLPIAMEHFVERFSIQPFVIYDEAHGMAGVYDLRKTTLVMTEQVASFDRTKEEREFQALWKRFYDSVSHDQRYNPSLRTSLMPQRFWENMVEFKSALE